MRAVSTCPAGVMGWSLGAPTQPSARTTQGSYFDKHGVLRFAPPGVLRPNYVYQNGAWVLDGYLKERASENLYSDIAIDTSNTGLEKLPEGSGYELLASVPVIKWTPSNSTAAINICNSATPNLATTQSIFVNDMGQSQVITFTRPWYWGPSITLNTGTGEVTGNTPGIQALRYGSWWRIGGWPIAANTAANNYARIQVTAATPLLMTANMLEPAVADSDGNYHPTSWIPYGQTRTAD